MKSYPEEENCAYNFAGRSGDGYRTGNKIRAFRLLPSQQFSLDKLTGQIEVKEVDTRLYTDWTEGMFVLENNAWKK